MATRSLRLFLTILLLPLLLAACSGREGGAPAPVTAPEPAPSGWIQAGGGEGTELARALEEGRLGRPAAGQACEEERAVAGVPAGSGEPPAPGRSQYRGPGDSEPPGAPPTPAMGFPAPATPPPPPATPAPGPAGPAPRMMDLQESRPDPFGALALLPSESEARRPSAAGGEEVPAAKKDQDGPTAATPQGWKRGGGRPSFARVYVGDGNSLELVRMRVTVTIDGPRARTVVDHVFRNPHDRRLEGTFEYPLPAGASACYFAMFLSGEQAEIPPFFAQAATEGLPAGALADMAPDRMARTVEEDRWGPLREARVVARQRAREVYEEVTRRRIDPALLEYAGGNTFQGRVFPIEPKGLNRVILAYEETLEGAGERLRYRFPLPDCPLRLLHVTASLSAGAAREDEWAPAAGAARKVAAGRIVWEQAWEEAKGPGGEAVLSFAPENPAVQAVSGPGPGKGCFLVRLRPDLPAAAAGGGATRAVFLVDTSLSEEPDRFNVSVNLLKRILEADRGIEAFNVLCFDVGAWWIHPAGWIANDTAGRKLALDALGEVLLEGATDLGAALELLARTRWEGMAGEVDLFLLTDGQVNWGERDPERMVAAFAAAFPGRARFLCYRTGLGAENLELFACLARRGGGVFNVFTEELAAAAALAHRRPCLTLDEVAVECVGGQAADLLVAGRQAAVYPGGELLLAGTFAKPGPAEVVVRGRFAGGGKVQRFPIELEGESELAGRAWAEIAVAQLLGLGDPELERLAVALAQRWRIGSKATSFLVLERDQDFEEFGLEKEAAALQAADLAVLLADRQARWLGPAPRRELFRRGLSGLRLDAAGRAEVEGMLALLADGELLLPAGLDPGALPRRDDAAPAYLEALHADRRKPAPHLAEAARRAAAGRPFLGVRTLANLVELFPGRGDAGRLAGYRLLSMDLPGPAALVFDSVREGRPFEPHSWRDLARSLELAGSYALAALHYEVLLAGSWHGRFHDSLMVIVREEYCRLLQEALRRRAVQGPLADRFGSRLEILHQGAARADLRVTIGWNTDGTDVDLWVHEPGGEACGYSHRETKNGGRLLDDLTEGYGPERYQIEKAPPGEYVVLVHYFSPNPNLLAGETHVEVAVTVRAGQEGEETRRFHAVLARAKQGYEVCRIRL